MYRLKRSSSCLVSSQGLFGLLNVKNKPMSCTQFVLHSKTSTESHLDDHIVSRVCCSALKEAAWMIFRLDDRPTVLYPLHALRNS